MWIWPLDNAMGATAAHKASERVVDGTCTQVWVWMTNKCRRRMNRGEGYIATEISQRGGGGGGEAKEKEKEEGREASGRREELGTHILEREVFSPWDVRPSDPVFLAPIGSSRLLPNQSSPHQSPTFGPTFYKFIVTGLLGLDSVRRWTQSEKWDPTITFLN